MKKLLIVLIIFMQSSFVFAQVSGQDWIDSLNNKQNMINSGGISDNELDLYNRGYNEGLLIGYLKGLVDANWVFKDILKKGGLKLVEHPTKGLGYALFYIDEQHFICIPEKVSYGQITKIMDRYLEDNPSKWHKSLYPLFRQAIKDAELNKCDMSDYSDSKLRENEFLKTQ